MKRIHSGHSRESKHARIAKERAPRFDKGTPKSAMASVLSGITISNTEKQKLRSNAPKILEEQPELNVMQLRTENEIATKSILCDSANDQGIRLLPIPKVAQGKKRQSVLAKPMFGHAERVPVFTLPSCERTKSLMKSFGNVAELPKVDENDRKHVPSFEENACKGVSKQPETECQTVLQDEVVCRHFLRTRVHVSDHFHQLWVIQQRSQTISSAILFFHNWVM
jgi:hypothetical protein